MFRKSKDYAHVAPICYATIVTWESFNGSGIALKMMKSIIWEVLQQNGILFDQLYISGRLCPGVYRIVSLACHFIEALTLSQKFKIQTYFSQNYPNTMVTGVALLLLLAVGSI